MPSREWQAIALKSATPFSVIYICSAMGEAMGIHKVLLLLLFLVSCNARDETLTAGASGSAVVHAVVRRIEDSNIFPSENQFLRRIAYVESKDGTDSGTYRSGYHGGIWQVDEVGFRDTQDIASHPGLEEKFDKIQETFGINWREVRHEDLRKPLYSALAARLFLSNNPKKIPVASDIRAQGRYWKKHYNTADGAGTVDKFIDDIKALLKQKSKYNSIKEHAAVDSYINPNSTLQPATCIREWYIQTLYV